MKSYRHHLRVYIMKILWMENVREEYLKNMICNIQVLVDLKTAITDCNASAV